MAKSARKKDCHVYGSLTIRGIRHKLIGLRFNRVAAENIMSRGEDWHQEVLWLVKCLEGRYRAMRNRGESAPYAVGYFDPVRDLIEIKDIVDRRDA